MNYKPAYYKILFYSLVMRLFLLFFKSKDFRPAYGRLHQLRALTPQGTPFLACTATTTRSIREEVIRSLDMEGCEFVYTSPDRPNIRYAVKPRTEIKPDMEPYIRVLKEQQINAPRVVVYCQSLNVCSDLYAHFIFELGDEAYYPAGAEKISDNRLVRMLHACTIKHNKNVC